MHASSRTTTAAGPSSRPTPSELRYTAITIASTVIRMSAIVRSVRRADAREPGSELSGRQAEAHVPDPRRAETDHLVASH